jgi:hypothetical protein
MQIWSKTCFVYAIAAMLAAFACHCSRAASIDIIVGAPGVLLPNYPSATVLSFDDLALGSLPSFIFNGGTLSGSAAIEQTTLAGNYARPAQDTTRYLTVSYLPP